MNLLNVNINMCRFDNLNKLIRSKKNTNYVLKKDKFDVKNC